LIMDDTKVELHFSGLLRMDEEKSPATACIETLLEVVNQNQAMTLAGLDSDLKKAIQVIQSTDYSATSVSSASELFLRFISLAALDKPDQDFSEVRKVLLERGQVFLKRVSGSRQRIAQLSGTFIRDGSVILTHSHSRVVFQALKYAAIEKSKHIHVYVTESGPDLSGRLMHKKLTEANIPCTLIVDAAIGYIMERVNVVMVGAEGVVETGGIINKIGTLTLGVCAKAAHKPVYVLAESVKFVKEFPLNQRDVPERFKYPASILKSDRNLEEEHPLVDYTPPSYISLLFTDLGILTPAAVSDELIKLYL